MNDTTNLNGSKIININDFIFRQNLEFYPNLQGLSCENNTIIYRENGAVATTEALTFDLRTLPGEAWNVTPASFITTIKINKSCKRLLSFIELMNTGAYNTMPPELLENNVTNYMNLYFSVKESFTILTEDNKILLSNIETLIASLPKESGIGKIVNTKLDEYFENTKKIGDTKGKEMALTLKNKNLPVVTEEEVVVKKAGYINVAILIYGVINIGIILAIALMK